MGLTDEMRLQLKEAPKDALLEILNTVIERYGLPNVELQLAMVADTGATENPFAKGSVRACDLSENPEPPKPLWFGIYPGKVTLLIGETGAGKSTVLYAFAVHAARNEPLYGVPFGVGRPLTVLYIDPENAGNFSEGDGGHCAVKLSRIGAGRPAGLIFHTGQGVNLGKASHIAALESYIKAEKVDMVIADPIANLFGTADENDNAEAARQMAAITRLSRTTGAAIVVVHHTGKADQSMYGRGATARLAAADTALMFRARSADEGDVDDTYGGETIERRDVCRLQIVKNRIEGKGSLYLRMAGSDRFELAAFDDWKQASARATSRSEPKSVSACSEIGDFLADGEWYSRKSIIEHLKLEGFGESTGDAGIKELLEAGEIEKDVERKGRGGPCQYRMKQEKTPDGTFLLSQNPLEEVRKYESSSNGTGAISSHLKALCE